MNKFAIAFLVFFPKKKGVPGKYLWRQATPESGRPTPRDLASLRLSLFDGLIISLLRVRAGVGGIS